MSDGTTFNYFDPNTNIRTIMVNTVVLSQQFQFCLEECNKFLNDITYPLDVNVIRCKSSMLAAYYMYTNLTFSVDIFRLTYCLRHIEDCWKEYDLDLVTYMLRAVTYGIQNLIATLQSNNM